MIIVKRIPITKRQITYCACWIGLILFVIVLNYYGQKQVPHENSDLEMGINSIVLVPVRNLTSTDLKAEQLKSDVSYANAGGNDFQSPRQICKCPIRELLLPNTISQMTDGSRAISTCSKEATDQGPGQKILSYSFYLNEPKARGLPDLFAAIEPLLNEVSLFFPGWLARIYTNVSLERPEACRIVCKYDFLFWCNVTNIPEMGNMGYINPRAWRFLAMGDPTVDLFLSRDLDSQITLRERVAVSEWENSNLTFHSMRDHPGHKAGMLGGMWGAKNYLLGPALSKDIQQQLVAAARLKAEKGWDKIIVTKHIYGRYRALILAHDSYFCSEFQDSVTLPYSIQRHGGETIGWRHLGSDSDLQPCPLKCRPTYGRNWKYC